MDEASFEKNLNEIINEIGSVPKPQQRKLMKLARNASKNHKKLKDTMDSLQDSLDYLRVSVKYLIFDLEATKRENSYLRNQIDQRGSS